MEDRLFNIAFYLKAKSIAYLNENVYFAHISNTSLTHKYLGYDTITQSGEIIKAFREMLPVEFSEECTIAFNAFIIERLLVILNQYVFHSQSEIPWYLRRKKILEITRCKDYHSALQNTMFFPFTTSKKILVFCMQKNIYLFLAFLFLLKNGLAKIKNLIRVVK